MPTFIHASIWRRYAHLATAILLAAGPVAATRGLAAAPAYAAPERASAHEPDPQFSLTVYPSRVDVPPGAGRHATVVHIKNGGNAAVPIQMSAAEFTQAPDGTLTFQPPGSWSATSWVHTRPQHFTLPRGRTRKVHVQITIPDRPEPGERYVGLLFKTPAVPAAGNILLQRSIAAKLFISVPGTISRHIEVGQLQAPSLSIGGAISLSLPIHNRGNIHQDYVHPHGLSARIGEQTLRFADFTVLAGSTRLVTAEWPDPPLLCLCQATISVPDGTGKTITRQVPITIVPLRETAGLLLAAAGLLLVLQASRRRHRTALARARQQGYHDALNQDDAPRHDHHDSN
ncbi:hypothetical protein [Nonomuraea sp. B19D2]|uniref:COG1470 family protein n=1 Tax=Nonomuraea sp. B19D2 TaxID=3159561 RepID=UPI0032DBEACD